jgi:DNA-binding CsgD family transcriptional regulator
MKLKELNSHVGAVVVLEALITLRWRDEGSFRAESTESRAYRPPQRGWLRQSGYVTLVKMVMTPEPVPEHPRHRLVLCLESDAEAANRNAEALIRLDYMFERPPDGDFTRASILEGKPDLVPCEVRLSRMFHSELSRELAEAGSPYATLSLMARAGPHNPGNDLDHRWFRAGGVNKLAEFEVLSLVFEERSSCGKRGTTSPSRVHLTNREEVLTWVGRGKTSAEVAMILGLSTRTVNFHCSRAVSRLDVTNQTQVVTKAIAEGLIAP